MKCTRKTSDWWHFYFVCEACGGEGKLKIPARMNGLRFVCSGCEAVYIPWMNPLTDRPDLMCVVRPIFTEESEGNHDTKRLLSRWYWCDWHIVRRVDLAQDGDCHVTAWRYRCLLCGKIIDEITEAGIEQLRDRVPEAVVFQWLLENRRKDKEK